MLTLRYMFELFNKHLDNPPNLDMDITGFSIDTRTLNPGNVFIALQGQRSHGNFFAQQAAQKGAIAIITDQPLDIHLPTLYVENSLTALWQIARYQRSRFTGTVCAVTGTVGKTSVKETLAFLCKALGRTMQVSEKSHNNHIGVPLTLSNLRSTTEIAVVELGMSHPGEIKPLAELTEPDIVLVTHVGPGHIEAFSGVQDIAKEKISIAAGLNHKGMAILPKDSEFFELMEKLVNDHYGGTVVSFGKAEVNPNVQAVSITMVAPNQLDVVAKVFDKTIDYSLPTSNYGWVNNSLAVLTVIHILGLDVHKAAVYLKDLPMIQGRGRIYNLRFQNKHIKLIDDAYNANPVSMRAALETLAHYPSRKLAVLGDMRELGEFSRYYHQEIGRLCEELAIDCLAMCGPYMKDAFDLVSFNKRLFHVFDSQEVLVPLLNCIEDGDIILFKGSNSTHLHQVVTQLIKIAEEESPVS